METHSAEELLHNLDKLHTTELGSERIKRNLKLDTDQPVEWCRQRIAGRSAQITRKGKNWYIQIDDACITVNAYSYTIITAHKKQPQVADKTKKENVRWCKL